MAAILKLPTDRSAGVVSFTTQERDNAINVSTETRNAVERLKDRWLIGLHHNWHDHSFQYDPLYDFSFAGEDDLREVSDVSFPVLGLDACNFTPEVFTPATGPPFWDVLFVARAVNFKRIPEFFRAIRALYDAGQGLRVLLICPVPPYDQNDEKTALYDVRARYEAMFSDDEQELFTLLTIDWRYPFPFDLPTLAHFYRSSRVFVHTADDERRCRVAAYAWASGLPVVSTAAVGSLLPASLRRAPWFFEARRDRDFPEQIIEAIAASPLQGDDLRVVRNQVSSEATIVRLLDALRLVAADRGLVLTESGFATQQLDIRLGRHHGIGPRGPNRVDPEVSELAALMNQVPAELHAAMDASDPERELEGLLAKRGILGHVRSAFSGS